MLNLLLCLDGPQNGERLSPEVARPLGYHVETWSTGEEVLVYAAMDAVPDFEAYDAAA